MGNGERLWPAGAAAGIVRWLADRGQGILGGEVYDSIPNGVGWGAYRLEWATDPLGRPETWAAFVDRGRDLALRAIADAERATPQTTGLVRLYFIACCTQSEYAAVLAMRRDSAR